MNRHHEQVYALALKAIKKYGWETEKAIFTSLDLFLTNKTKEEERTLLGDEIYVDYLMYQQRFERGEYNCFHTVLETFLKVKSQKTSEQKDAYLKIGSTLDERFKKKIAIGKITEEYFTKENLEKYINYKKII